MTNSTKPYPLKTRKGAVGTLRKAKNFFACALLCDKVFLKREEQHIIDASLGVDGFVPYYLYCHSIELSLKSFLMVHGLSDEALKNIGHNLEKALKTAEQYGLNDVVHLTEEQKTAICWTSDYYKEKAFEYLITGYYQLPELQYVHSASKSLIDGLQAYVDEAVLAAVRINDKVSTC